MIRPEDVQQALTATGRVNWPSCRLTHEVVLWVVLAMGLLTDLPIRQVFKAARRLRKGEESPHRSSLCVARQRLGVAPVRHLFLKVVRPLARPETPGAFSGGFLRLMGLDGTIFDVPDSEANAAVFARPSAGPRSALPSGPQAQLGRSWGPMSKSPWWCGPPPMASRAMVAGLFRHLTSEMLLLWDRGFFSYELWQQMTAHGEGVPGQERVDLATDQPPVQRLVPGQDLQEPV